MSLSTSFWERVSIHLRNDALTSPAVCGCSKSTSRARRHGSGGDFWTLGFGIPEWLRLVPADFEASGSWWRELAAGGFDRSLPAVVASTGVSMYLSKEATMTTLRQLAELAPGSKLAMTFLLPPELLDQTDRSGLEKSQKGATTSGTPFVSFYPPEEIVTMAREAGFTEVHHIAGSTVGDRYFGNRSDGLRPSTGEDFLVAAV